MKTIIFTLLAAALTTTLSAQELTVQIDTTGDLGTIATADTIETSQGADTAIIRIGKKEIKVIDRNVDKIGEKDNDDCFTKNNDTSKKKKHRKFKGHWGAIELGFNGFDNADYSMYEGNKFMSLNPGKSMEVNANFGEVNIPLIGSYIGLVSGIGISFNNYRFDNPITLVKGAERVEPVTIESYDISKTKLTVSYLKVPLLFEFQIPYPFDQHRKRVFVNAGVLGSMKIGSHTKVKYDNYKGKNRSGYYLNYLNYAATARIGYDEIGLFANYSLTPLFEEGKGPELTPYTIGISFNFD